MFIINNLFILIFWIYILDFRLNLDYYYLILIAFNLKYISNITQRLWNWKLIQFLSIRHKRHMIYFYLITRECIAITLYRY